MAGDSRWPFSGRDGSAAGGSLTRRLAVRSRRITSHPLAGLTVMLRLRARSPCAPTGCSSQRSSTARSASFISSSAKLAPRQRRRPPPNGIHV